MADRDLTDTLTVGQQCFDFYHQDCMISGSADFDMSAPDVTVTAGAAGPTLIVDDFSSISLSNSIDWNAINSTITLGSLMHDPITTNSAMQVTPSGRLSLTGDDADIEINGESIVSVLGEIRDRLSILKVSETMEAEWDELRELREQYQAKLAECREKSQAWGALQQTPPKITQT
jgi:hypothetical protein